MITTPQLYFVLTQTNAYYLPNSDNFYNIIEEYKIKDDYVRVKIVVSNRDEDFSNVENYKITVIEKEFPNEEKEYPQWAEGLEFENRVKEALKERIESQKIGKTVTGGIGSKIEVGYFGTAIVGKNGRAIAGDYGKAISGNGGYSIAGEFGLAKTENFGTAIVGWCGKAVVKDEGTAMVEMDGVAICGDRCTVHIGSQSIVIAGKDCSINTGPMTTFKAGEGSNIYLKYYDGHAEIDGQRYVTTKVRHIIIGKTPGIKANTFYEILDESGELFECDQQHYNKIMAEY